MSRTGIATRPSNGARAGIPQYLHAESLLRLPLVARAMTDPRMRPRRRAVDARWAYLGILAKANTGFRPFAGELLFAAISCFERWRAHPERSARSYNPGDRLVREVLFYAHDYIHCWTYALIRAALPAMELGYGKITEKNQENLAFLHLLTEAAATVGLDYWYLSTIRIDEVCPIGTRWGPLTVGYHQSDLSEFQRARPDFVVDRRDWFTELASFYCTGVIDGFDARDLRRSPKLYAWLSHELQYGMRQRQYSRQWIAYLGGHAVSDTDSGRAIGCDKPWQRRLIGQVGEALWSLVKDGLDAPLVMIDPTDAWSSPPNAPPDPRFIESSHVEDEAAVLARYSSLPNRVRGIAMEQMLLRHDYGHFDRDKLRLLEEILGRRDLAALKGLLVGERRVSLSEKPARDLFVLP